MTFDYEAIRPYKDDEIHPALLRIAENPEFYAAINWLFPELSAADVKKKITSIHTTYEFQKQFMHVGIRKIVEKTSDGLTCDGFENIEPKGAYLYVSNHRDIFLDSGLLQILLFEKKIDTTQISMGSNLMKGIMVDVGKVNKMFTVFREGSIRELYNNSLRLSSYLRYALTEMKNSAWIAQREGRTKNGCDATQSSVLKMFAMSNTEGFVSSFNDLNLAPVSISYEYEPCDYLKAYELYKLEKDGKYQKAKDEDLNSIIRGVRDYKGRIHLAVSEPVAEHELIVIDTSFENGNDKIRGLAELIDKKIFSLFKLWPTNYIAADILSGNNRYSEKYTTEEKDKFVKIMQEKLNSLPEKHERIEEIFLNIYANPVSNVIKSANQLFPEKAS